MGNSCSLNLNFPKDDFVELLLKAYLFLLRSRLLLIAKGRISGTQFFQSD